MTDLQNRVTLEEFSPCLFLAVQIDWIAHLDFSHFEGCPTVPLSHLLPARLWPTCIPAEGCRKWTGNIPKITQKQFLRSWPVITHQEAWEAVCRQQAPTQGVGIPGYWQAGGSDVPGFPLPSIYPTKMFSLDLALTHNHPQHTSYLSGPVISKKELSIDSLELTSFSEDRTVKDDTEGLWGK